MLLMAKRRMESRYFETRAIIEAILAPYTEGKGLNDALTNYTDAMFPFLATHRVDRDRQYREVLKRWTDNKALVVTPLVRPSDRKRLMSRLKRGAEFVKQREELERTDRTRK